MVEGKVVEGSDEGNAAKGGGDDDDDDMNVDESLIEKSAIEEPND